MGDSRGEGVGGAREGVVLRVPDMRAEGVSVVGTKALDVSVKVVEEVDEAQLLDAPLREAVRRAVGVAVGRAVGVAGA